jgi:hypothetical protein
MLSVKAAPSLEMTSGTGCANMVLGLKFCLDTSRMCAIYHFSQISQWLTDKQKLPQTVKISQYMLKNNKR